MWTMAILIDISCSTTKSFRALCDLCVCACFNMCACVSAHALWTWIIEVLSRDALNYQLHCHKYCKHPDNMVMILWWCRTMVWMAHTWWLHIKTPGGSCNTIKTRFLCVSHRRTSSFLGIVLSFPWISIIYCVLMFVHTICCFVKMKRSQHYICVGKMLILGEIPSTCLWNGRPKRESSSKTYTNWIQSNFRTCTLTTTTTTTNITTKYTMYYYMLIPVQIIGIEIRMLAILRFCANNTKLQVS